jgi:hypothetical protein
MQVERRRKERMAFALPVSVSGSEGGGKEYQFETIARDIGAGGLCAFAPRKMKLGETLSLRVRFAHPGSRAIQAPEVTMRGLVVRTEARPTGLYMFAVSFILNFGG